MKEKMFKAIFISVFVIAIIIFFLMHKDLMHAVIARDFKYVKAYLLHDPLIFYVTSFFMMMIQNSFILIPLVVLISINIMILGLFNGIIWTWLTSIVASITVFFSARYLFKPSTKPGFFKNAQAKIEKNAKAFVFQARVLPILPSSAINILSGVSSMRWLHFIAATVIGNLLHFVVLALILKGLFKYSLNGYSITVIVVIIALFFIAKRLKLKNVISSRFKKNTTRP